MTIAPISPRPPQPPHDEEAGIFELTQQLVSDTSALAQTELRRLEHRAARAAEEKLQSLVLAAAGLALSTVGLVAVAVGVVWGLVALGLPPWLSACGVGVVLLVIGGAMMRRAQP